MRKIIKIFFLMFLIVFIQNKNFGIIKTCSGWRLNKLPEIKNFLKYDVQYYDVEVVYPGGDPIFCIIDNYGNEIEQISLINLKRDEIGELIEKKGFKKFNL